MAGAFRRPKYTAKQKANLLKNLDLEVQDRVRQIRARTADALETFIMHQDAQVLRVPKPVRTLTMADFGAKYGGDIQAALRGIRMELMAAEAEGAASDRKRKFAEGETEGSGTGDAEGRAAKNPRMMIATPRKRPGTAAGTPRSRAQLTRTPGTARPMHRMVPAPSPSPQKLARPPFSTSAFPRTTPFRPASPAKPMASTSTAHLTNPAAAARPHAPSSATFNPVLPRGAARMPRHGERMLSVNGSPLANPLALAHDEAGKGAAPTPRANGLLAHGRTASQPVLFAQLPAHPPARPLTHARTQSQLAWVGVGEHGAAEPEAQPATMITLPLRSGHTFSFDPLAGSPSLDALDELGLTDSARKTAREEVLEKVRSVHRAMERWKI